MNLMIVQEHSTWKHSLAIRRMQRQLVSPVFGAFLAFPVASYYLVRPLSSPWLRFGIATAGCSAFTYLASKEIVPGTLAGMLKLSLCWMNSIRLVDLMTRPEAERMKMSFQEYVWKFTYFFLPVSRNPTPRPLKEHLLHLGYHAGLFAGKVIVADFTRTWFLRCSLLSGGGDVARHNYWLTVQLVSLFSIGLFASSAMSDLQMLLVSAVTRDRYEVLPFHNWPVLATSFREFWSKRYNLLVGSLLHESVFTPLQRCTSRDTAALAAFAVSGLLHAHVARVCFGGSTSDVACAFGFFALQGLFCLLESRVWRPRNPLLGALITQVGLALTAPLYLGLFVYASPAWCLNNQPEFNSPIHFNVPAWLYCPKP